MRFKLTCSILKAGRNVLPVNYQYELSAWIYHTLHQANPAFSEWLHEKGYTKGTQRFKFFTFSKFEIPKGGYRIEGDRLVVQADEISLLISFLMEEAAVPFITGLFQNQEFVVGDRESRIKMKVIRVERLPDPVFKNEMEFITLSPLVVSKSRMNEGGNGTAYLSPEDTGYEKLFLQNLARKVWNAGTDSLQAPEISNHYSFKLIGPARKKGITFKANTPQQTKVIGYEYKFRIVAPPEWIRVGYFAGFGEKNSEGMGCVEIGKYNLND